MREMKDTRVRSLGKIPKGWRLSRLKYVSNVLYGYPLDSNHFSEEGFPIIRIRDITSGNVETYYDGEFPDKYIIKSGDILLGMDGDFNLREWKNVDAVLNQRCCKINGGKNAIRKYLYYALQWTLKVKNDETYSTTVKHLLADGINNLQIALPTIDEQQKIVDYLDFVCAEIDTLSADIQSEIETLEEYKRSVITEAVTKGLNKNVPMKDSGIEWVGEIPASWGVEKGKYCLRYVQKPTRPDDDVITCFRDGEVTLRKNRREDGFTISLKEIGYQGIDVGDLIVHGMDGFAGAIGISDSRGKASPVLNVLDTDNNKRYIMYYLRSLAINGVFLALATGIRVRTCDTNWGKLRELLYVLPPKAEQVAIVRFVDDKLNTIDEIIAQKQEQLTVLADYKKSIIYEYVTGKKEVPDGNI